MGAALSPLLFPLPPRGHFEHQLRNCRDLRWVTTKTAGKTPALFHQLPNAKYTLLYTHGNAEDLGELMSMVPEMANRCGASVFAVEYPGYSISQADSPSESYCYDAVESAWKHLVEVEKVNPRSVVPFGRSLGSGPAVHIAAQQREPPGLILQSPLESGARAVMNKYVGWVGYPFDPFKNYAKVGYIEAKTCIIHGTADTVVPFSNGQALYDELKSRNKAAEPLWIKGRGHNDMPPERVFERIRKFLAEELP
mmetsp:Transcript_54302/g.129404  ORF Transcript_54302/g.129404 Transcript_54302/m.129404 type:complete len:252 (-) Transcript_54302:188-943(-)